MTNPYAIKSLPDQLAQVRAQLAELKDKEAELKDAIVRTGEKRVPGVSVDAIVVEADKANVAWKKIAEKLKPSRQLIAAYTSYSHSVSVRIVSVKAEKAA